MRNWILLLGLLFSGFLAGQPDLSLAEAVQRGLNNNYGIRIAKLDAQIAGNNNSWGNAGRWPRLDLNMSGSAARTGNPAAFSPGRETGSGSIDFNWTLFDGFAIQANKARFELLEKQSLGNAALVIENTVQEIILGYYEVLVAEEQLTILKEILDNSAERLAYEEFRKDLGSTGTFEILQFKNAYITDSTNVIAQQLVRNNAQRSLNLVMNEPIEAVFALTDKLPNKFEAYEFGALLSAMSQNNQNLKNQFFNQQLRIQETRIARSGMYPVVGINAGTTYGLGRVLRRSFSSDTIIAQNFGAFDYNAGFTLTFNLFNGRNLQRQIQNAQLNEAITEMQTEDLKQSLSNELSVHFENFQARQQILNLQTENVANARLNLDLAAERFQASLINSLDYRTIQLQYRNAQLSRLQALRNLNESNTQLVRLTGGFVQEN